MEESPIEEPNQMQDFGIDYQEDKEEIDDSIFEGVSKNIFSGQPTKTEERSVYSSELEEAIMAEGGTVPKQKVKVPILQINDEDRLENKAKEEEGYFAKLQNRWKANKEKEKLDYCLKQVELASDGLINYLFGRPTKIDGRKLQDKVKFLEQTIGNCAKIKGNYEGKLKHYSDSCDKYRQKMNEASDNFYAHRNVKNAALRKREELKTELETKQKEFEERKIKGEDFIDYKLKADEKIEELNEDIKTAERHKHSQKKIFNGYKAGYKRNNQVKNILSRIVGGLDSAVIEADAVRDTVANMQDLVKDMGEIPGVLEEMKGLKSSFGPTYNTIMGGLEQLDKFINEVYDAEENLGRYASKDRFSFFD